MPVSVGDVENEDEADDVTIEGGRQAAVPFLSGRVPDLKIQVTGTDVINIPRSSLTTAKKKFRRQNV